MASLEVDFWELDSGEARHSANPETFWIPGRGDREHLSVGQKVKLLFCLEGIEEDGSIAVQCERMWVRVTEVLAEGTYIGVLRNQPASYDPSSSVYLVVGAEVPFRAEHVVDIAELDADGEEASPTPSRFWSRE